MSKREDQTKQPDVEDKIHTGIMMKRLDQSDTGSQFAKEGEKQADAV